ncbi:MAG: hypothetical protein OXU64_03065 [Gemmatimonadota bacterium]|nr:hypothetical protein [Deltaproteobacteria bacterium]MDE2973694.1 hypothetical protein [Gemmatimonadota bacterium]
MKLLLDESMPRRLAAFFPESFTVRTVQQMDWSGCGNGDLLRLAAKHEFDALVTVDQGIEHEQNVNRLPIPVVIMRASRTRLKELQPLVPGVLDVLSGDLKRRVYHVSA